MRRVILAAALVFGLAATGCATQPSGTLPSLQDLYEAGVLPSPDPRDDFRETRLALEQNDAAQQAPAYLLDGLRAAERGDYSTAVKEWLPRAERGDAAAQYFVGRMYLYGWGLPKDYAEAARWYRLAAEQGFSPAQSDLGNMYAQGLGVSKDLAEGARWIQRAAEQRDETAQSNLGLFYYHGWGVPKDYTQAEKWFRKAAEQGFPAAQGMLGGMYGTGHGVPKDFVMAYMWLNLAVSGLPPGNIRDKLSRARELAAKEMTPAQIAEAQRLAREWWEEHQKAD